MKTKTIILGLFFIGFAVAVQAQTATPGVTDRQVNQQKRIKQGVNNGELTKAETIELQKQQRRINKSKKAAKADGVVTNKEKVGIHARQNHASNNVYRKKHNGRDRN